MTECQFKHNPGKDTKRLLSLNEAKMGHRAFHEGRSRKSNPFRAEGKTNQSHHYWCFGYLNAMYDTFHVVTRFEAGLQPRKKKFCCSATSLGIGPGL